MYTFEYMLFFVKSTMVQAIERYMKQAIVDRNPSVSSAALISALVSHSYSSSHHLLLLLSSPLL